MQLNFFPVNAIISVMLMSAININSFKLPFSQLGFFKSNTLSFKECVPSYDKRALSHSTVLSLSSNNSPNTLNSRISKPTLTQNSLWKLTIFLQKEGFQSVEATVRVRFIQSKNYEPPQGKVFIEDDYNGLVRADDDGYGGIWTLSEDKEDRKDGLWVWGLFEEPKYPFLYFYLDIYSTMIVNKADYKVTVVKEPEPVVEETAAAVIDKQQIIKGINSEIKDNSYLNSVVKIEIKNPKLASVSSSSKPPAVPSQQLSEYLTEDQIEIPIFDGKSIPKNRLNFRFNFSQKSMSEGVSISSGIVNYQLQEVVDADMFGLGGKVDVGEYVEAGRVNILYVPEV